MLWRHTDGAAVPSVEGDVVGEGVVVALGVDLLVLRVPEDVEAHVSPATGVLRVAHGCTAPVESDACEMQSLGTIRKQHLHHDDIIFGPSPICLVSSAVLQGCQRTP